MANPIAIDAQDLQYYDKQIKKYIDDKDTELKASLSNISEIDKRIDEIAEKTAAHSATLISHREELDDIEAAIIVLQNDDKSIHKEVAELKAEIQNKLDESAMEYLATKQDLESLATREYVKEQIREAGDIDLSDYAKKSDLDNIADSMLSQNAAISKRLDDQTAALSAVHTEIENVQNNLEQYITESELTARNYATKPELEAVQRVAGENSVKLSAIESDLFDIEKKLETIPSKISELENDTGFITEIPSEYVTETELDEKGYITEHQSLENYATKEFVENSIESINIPDTSKFITIADVEAKGYATEDYVLEHVNTQIETEVETQVTEVVEKQVTEVVQTQVKDEVAEQLAKNEKINYGTFGEV